MTTFEEMIDGMSVLAKTKQGYKNTIKSIESVFEIPMKEKVSIDCLKEYIESLEFNQKLVHLNVIIVLRKSQDLDNTSIKKYRTLLQAELKSSQVIKLQIKAKNMHSLEEFKEELDKAFESTRYIKYIVNYLLMTYGVRNQDLDVHIIKTKKEMEDKTKNYLLIQKGQIKYERNVYKTVSTFNAQSVNITDERFNIAVSNIPLGKLFEETQMSNALRKFNILKMNESDIFKMMIEYNYSQNNSEEIKRLASSRGTSLDTVETFYDLNIKSLTPIEKAKLL